MTDSKVSSALAIPREDLNRLRNCQHHDPHGFYGWHGNVVRTRQLGAEKVELLLDGNEIPMQPIGDDIFAVEVAGEPRDYRLRITWPGFEPRVTATPTRSCPPSAKLIFI